MNDILMYTCLHLTTPCAVTSRNGLPYFNQAMKALLLDSPLALELFRAQEKKARESGQFFSVQNQWPFGPEQTLKSYLFDFYPQFDCVYEHPVDAEFECIGTICHARPFAFGSTGECVDGEAPRPATFARDRRFTEKECEIIFFTLHGLTAKDVARRLEISNRTVENRLRVIFNKSGTHCARELAMYCRENGTDRYYSAIAVVAIEPRFEPGRCRMMYLKVKFIRNTDHPHGRKTLEGYIAAENKTVVKAAEYLYEQDGKFAIYYKAPRFEEITEALYISKIEKQLDHVDESAIKQYCALLSLFSEQESYDEDEVRDAEAMISNPEGEESEDVARYS